MAEKSVAPRVTKENYCKNTRQELPCEECDKIFTSVRRGHRFCSWECSRKYIRRTKPFVPKTVSCKLCRKVFKQKRAWQTFCSSPCRDRWFRNPKARGGQKKCKTCNGNFIPKKTWNQHYCSKECKLVGLAKATDRYRVKNRSTGLCGSCKNEKLPHSSYLCEEHWFNKAARSNGLRGRDDGKALKKIIEKQNYTCPYSGKKLVLGINASVDHINPKSRFPNQAFLLTNIEWVDISVNTIKADLTKDEFISLCKLIASRCK